MKKTVAIIDSTNGEMSLVIAHHLAKSGYPLLLSDKDSERFEYLKRSILTEFPMANIEALPCPHECAWEADVILLSICDDMGFEMIEKIKDVVTGKLIINVIDPKKKECINKLLPFSKIVQVMDNGTFSESDSLILSGSDVSAVRQVSELMKDIGISSVFIPQDMA